jgi:hypothetical protein
MLRIRSTIFCLAVLVGVVIAGCGGGGGSSSSSSSELASLASPGSVVFLEAQLQPKGELKANVEAAGKRLVGTSDVGEFILTKLEESGGAHAKSIDFATEVEPWLGEKGAIGFESFEDGEFSEPIVAVETTNPKESQAFLDKQASEQKPSTDVTYKGVEFTVGGPEKSALGVVGKTVLFANSEKEFKAAVDASQGESLGGEDSFQNTMANATKNSLADIYVDLGGIITNSKGEIDPQMLQALESTGIDPEEATAVASVIPGAGQIEVDVSSEASSTGARGGAPKLLGSLPANSFAATSFADFGEQFEAAVDNLDEEGIPPEVGPGELKSDLEQAGVNIDKIAASLDEGAIFAEGDSKASLGGALVVTAKSSEAADAIGSLGGLLRAARVPGVTVVKGKASGFSISSSVLGKRPLVVVGKGDRIAVGYGLAQALTGLDAGSGPTLSGTADYKAAVAALGKTPISGYVDGSAALRLAEALIPRSKTEFWEAVPYLKKITYVGIGTASGGDSTTTAKLIAGIGK